MRVSKRNSGLYSVCSALGAVCLWGLGIAAPSNGSAISALRIPRQNPNGIQIYLRSGLKTHGPGQHDYPQFLSDWSKLLTQHGAVVDGSLHGAIAWAGRHPVDGLVDHEPPPAAARLSEK